MTFKKIILLIILSVIAIIKINVYAEENIPKLYFTGNIENMTEKTDVRDVEFIYKDADIEYNGFAKLKIQGNSSLYYDKKNYTINLYKDSFFESKYKINFGWGKQSKYCLKANWIDYTHSRNIVTANIAAEINAKYSVLDDTPNHGVIDGYPIEIYINNDFLGLYTLNIPKDKWMVNIDDKNENNILISAKTYSSTTFFKKETFFGDSYWEIEEGPDNEQTIEKLNRIIRFVNNSSDKEFRNNISNYFNIDSLINFYVLFNYGYLLDNSGKNFLLLTYDGLIWYYLPYDLDTTWGMEWQGLYKYDYSRTEMLEETLVFHRLRENFSQEIIKRYKELRKTILNKEYILNKFNEFESLIPETTFEKEKERWEDIPGFGIDQIEEYLDFREPLLDEFFDDFDKITSLEIKKPIETINIGETYKLDLEIKPYNSSQTSKIKYESSNQEIVKIENGEITSVSPGEATIKISINDIVKEFNITVLGPIEKITLNETKINLEIGNNYQLTGDIYPNYTYNDKTLIWSSSDKNIVSVDQNGLIKVNNAGTAIINVTSENGIVTTCSINVKKINFNSLTITPVTNREKTGKEITPGVTIKYNNTKLKLNKDYTLSYKNNKNIGKASIIIKLKGNYEGTKTINFNIVPKKVTIKEPTSGKKYIRVKFDSLKEKTGYQIQYREKNSKEWKYMYVTGSGKKITNLKSGKIYEIRVRSYKTINKVKYFSSFSEIKYKKCK